MHREDKVRLEIVSIERKEDNLRIDYAIANESSEVVFVAVRSFLRGRPSRRPYTSLIDDELHLSFVTPPVPQEIEVPRAFTPFFIRMKAEELHKDSLQVEVPVSEVNPYYPMEPPTSDREIRATRRLLLKFEYIFKKDTAFIQEVDLEVGLFIVGGYPKYFARAALDLEEQPLLVLYRKDNFLRI